MVFISELGFHLCVI